MRVSVEWHSHRDSIPILGTVKYVVVHVDKLPSSANGKIMKLDLVYAKTHNLVSDTLPQSMFEGPEYTDGIVVWEDRKATFKFKLTRHTLSSRHDGAHFKFKVVVADSTLTTYSNEFKTMTKASQQNAMTTASKRKRDPLLLLDEDLSEDLSDLLPPPSDQEVLSMSQHAWAQLAQQDVPQDLPQQDKPQSTQQPLTLLQMSNRVSAMIQELTDFHSTLTSGIITHE